MLFVFVAPDKRFQMLKSLYILFFFIPSLALAQIQERTVLIFGDSLTAGYGVDPDDAFPNRLQHLLTSKGTPTRVIGAGVSGETSAGGVRRIDWVLRNRVDIFVLELGANDGLRGSDTEQMKKNLQIILDRVKQKHPEAKLVIAGMLLPPNMGERYTKRFAEVYRELATENKAALIPFLLEEVGGVRALNQADGIHPTAEGHKKIAETMLRVIEPILQSL